MEFRSVGVYGTNAGPVLSPLDQGQYPILPVIRVYLTNGQQESVLHVPQKFGI